ncbi:MAG: PIN domain-containing protein [Candidatus Brocadiae bacterium]|nr:PIN domain-containing protein [Candidatus Brocadiia bacterium]
MSDRVFLDTNILIYAFDRTDPAKHATARRLVEETVADGTFTISLQVLQEFYSVCTRKLDLRLRKEKAAVIVAEFLHHRVVEPNSGMLLKAVDLSRTSMISLYDAMIVVAAASAACPTLFTEDLSAGSSLAGVRVVNPFLPPPQLTPKGPSHA